MKNPPIENLLLLGDEGRSARHIAFCRAKAVDFSKNLIKGATLSKRLIFRDGWAIIKVAEGRRKIIIYTESGSCTYEFFTSELIDYSYIFTPPFDGVSFAYSVCGKGSFHQLGSGQTSTPLVSLCDGCSDTNIDGNEDELPYRLMSCETNVGLEDMKTPDFWTTIKTQPYLWYQGFRGEKFVIGGHDNAPYFKQNRMLNRFNARVDPLPTGGFGWLLFSIGSRIPSAFAFDGFAPYSVGGFTPGAGERMWGGALINTPTHELICCVGQDNKWKFWETGDWSGGAPPRLEEINAGLGPTISHGLSTIQFNQDGTKAVVVLTEYEQSPPDANSNDVYKAIQGTFQGLTYGSGNVTSSYTDPKVLAYEEKPWLIEYQIDAYDDINNDWQVTVSQTGFATRYHSTGAWVLAADYLGKDYDGPGGSFPAGSMVAAFMEARYDDINGLLGAGNPPYWPDDMDLLLFAAIHIKIYSAGSWNTIRTLPMVRNVRTQVQVSPVQDPYGNNQWGFLSSMFPGSDETSTEWLQLRNDKIIAFNLKTLSWVRSRAYRTNEIISSSGEKDSTAIEVWVNNQIAHKEEIVHEDHDPEIFSPSNEFTWPPLDSTEMPTYTIDLLGPLSFSIFDPELRGQFAWHPKGHWAVCESLIPIPPFQDADPLTDDFFMVDVVSAVGKKFTHKSLYNAAFGDTRDYSYYNDADDYRGVFMTAGLFRDK